MLRLAHAHVCLLVLVQNPIFPEPQELIVDSGHYGGSHGESIYPTEIGKHCNSGLCFLPWRTCGQMFATAGGPVTCITLAKSFFQFLEAWFRVYTCLTLFTAPISGSNIGSGRNTVDTKWLTFHWGNAEGITVQ